MATAHENGTRLANMAESSIASDFVPPERSSSASAPPVLELATESLFAFSPTATYANIFSDIRAHEDYYEYYQQNRFQKKLPPPLDPAPFLYQEEDLLGGFDSHRFFNNFSGGSSTQDSLLFEARRQLQELQLSNSGVNATEENSDWSPPPRRTIDFGEDPSRVCRSRCSRLTTQDTERRNDIPTDISYSSSPSAQTAFRSAQYIWKDEEPLPSVTNYAQPFATPASSTNGAPNLIANALENSLAQNSYFGQPQRSTSPRTTVSPPPVENSQEHENGTTRSNIICRYYSGGYCSRGDKCFYSHDLDGQKSKNDYKNKTPTKAKPFKNGKANPVSPRHSGSAGAATSAAIPTPDQYYTDFNSLIGKIYLVSRDQQGCRFLQKKLEEKDPHIVETIFSEVYEHITELMTDPFGNYLCQKLLEHCNDNQRLAIVERVSPNLVSISKNMHGTRAVQKMIECLSTPAQIQIVIRVLSNSVVELIQDLNGNHVIQRCLNRLSPADNQFIYDAVTSGDNCVQVATHRHGCCVLQRCIDHASDQQKIQLIEEITKNALTLVQDAYGNYVVQYVLELPFPHLVHTLAGGFVGHIRQLSTQKFSSNVIEKCLSLASADTRAAMIKEILSGDNLIVMLQDPFANYVVQTALSVSDSQQHHELVEAIKPHLPQLRNTPYGKRIQSKIAKETSERASRNKRA